MSRRRSLFVSALALFATSCASEAENPFVDVYLMQAPNAESNIIFTSNAYTAAARAPREIFAVAETGGPIDRLTFCDQVRARCDFAEAAPAPDRKRVAVRRIDADTNGDGRIDRDDGAGLAFLDLSRGVETVLAAPTARIASVDWSPTFDSLAYTGAGVSGNEDLFRRDVDTADRPNINLTSTANLRERRARFDNTGSMAAYERIGETLKSSVWIFISSASQRQITSGGPGSEALPGTPYIVGSDADPDYSPDGQAIVFRRLTGTGNGGLGTWDLLTARPLTFEPDGKNLTTIASGGVYRGPPDWGPRGIVFNEIDVVAGTSSIVIINPGGSNRRVPVTRGHSVDLTFPRWLR